MKNPLLLLLLVLTPSCKTFAAAMKGDDDAQVDAQAQSIGTAAGDAAGLITGNPLVDMGVTAVVAAGAGIFLRFRKKKAKPAPETIQTF